MLSGLRWFENYVPRSLVMRLIRLGEGGVESEERPVTVMFIDIVGFTAASQRLTPRDTADFLNHHFALVRSEEHTSELQSLMRISYAVFCLTKKNKIST